MATADVEHLVKMLNQITNNIGIGETDDLVAAKVADHLRRFWARPMREGIASYVAEGGGGLVPVALTAVAML